MSQVVFYERQIDADTDVDTKQVFSGLWGMVLFIPVMVSLSAQREIVPLAIHILGVAVRGRGSVKRWPVGRYHGGGMG